MDHQHRNASFAPLGQTLRKVVPALREADVPFLLGGSLAAWARGGPESSHDVDLMIRPEDVDRALDALEAAGLRPERAPEDWLVKAWDGEVLVDLIFCGKGLPITDEVLHRGEELSVLGVTVRVMDLADVLVTKLLALDEHALDYESILQIARSLREQIDWEDIAARTEASPYARAFFTLAEGLGIVTGDAAGAVL